MRIVMRNRLEFAALSKIDNRYELCRLASKATRQMHRPRARIADTLNQVLRLIGEKQI